MLRNRNSSLGSAAAQEVGQSRAVAVVHTLRILGVDFRTRIDGKSRPTYQDRLTEARKRLGRVGCLPVSFMAKCLFLRQLVVPVAVWGTWFVYGAASTWKQLQQRLLVEAIPQPRPTCVLCCKAIAWTSNSWQTARPSPCGPSSFNLAALAGSPAP